MATSWMTTIALGAPPQTRYRVELDHAGEIRALGTVSGVPAHHTSLEPYITDLLLHDTEGQLLLIDEDTNVVVARRQVQPYGMKPRERFVR